MKKIHGIVIQKEPALFSHDITTRFGSVIILWKQKNDSPAVVRILLSNKKIETTYPTAAKHNCNDIQAISDRINALLDGDFVEFPFSCVDLSPCSPFQQHVLKTQHAIPFGQTRTYLDIAREIGHPKSARAVGNALAANPFPLIIPCHRTIRSDGTIGHYQGDSAMKRFLIEQEKSYRPIGSQPPPSAL